MKNLIIFFSIVLSLGACSQNDEEKEDNNSIIGTWQLVEIYGGDGSDSKWTPVENGYVYTFKANDSLISNRFSCDGIYKNAVSSLTIDFNCSESQFNLKYNITFENDTFILTPNPNPCDEGCAEKYKRLQKNEHHIKIR